MISRKLLHAGKQLFSVQTLSVLTYNSLSLLFKSELINTVSQGDLTGVVGAHSLSGP